jgi:hypothetical protein
LNSPISTPSLTVDRRYIITTLRKKIDANVDARMLEDIYDLNFKHRMKARTAETEMNTLENRSL